MLLQVHAMLDEFVVEMYADHVRAGQEGLFVRRMVFGTISYGYHGVPIPGEYTKRKRPRCRIEIDPVTSRIVMMVFSWYALDHVGISAIVRRLNDMPDSELPPRSTSGAWTYLAVRHLLENGRYRGFWEYGRTKLTWQSKKDYARQVPREKPLRAEQIEELRIVPDDLWYAAQTRLAEEDRSNVGRKARDGDEPPRARILHGLFRCPTHDRILYVGGAHGRYLFCASCRALSAAKRPLYSYLPTKLALTLSCRALASLIVADEDLIAQVVVAAQEQARLAQQPDPTQLEELRRLEKQHAAQIQFIMDNAGDTEADRQESSESLKSHRYHRADVQAAISRLEAASRQPNQVPDKATIRSMMLKLDDMLVRAANGDVGEEPAMVRAVLRDLTGGCIYLYQQGERAAQEGWLQGRFTPHLVPYLLTQAAGPNHHGGSSAASEVVIDYHEKSLVDEEVERAMALYDQGMLNCQIAASLGCARNWVTKVIRRGFASRGLPPPQDGRERRTTLQKKQKDLTQYEQFAAQAKVLWDEGLSDLQIAARLGCSTVTVTAAIEYWHSGRGLPTPSHSDRRRLIIDRMLALYEENLLIREIAEQVGMCSRSVTLLLRERFESLGRSMSDGRMRRAARGQKGAGTGEQATDV